MGEIDDELSNSGYPVLLVVLSFLDYAAIRHSISVHLRISHQQAYLVLIIIQNTLLIYRVVLLAKKHYLLRLSHVSDSIDNFN
jgi:hypothetical protein